jgi:hypothetical protein
MNSAFFKKNWYFFTPAALVLFPVLLMFYYTASYGYSTSDSLNAVLHFGSTGTRYSIGFSERQFSLIRTGMDGRAVFGMIRNPMQGVNPGADVATWHYSLPASGVGYYHERAVVLEKDGNGIQRVKQLISRFHAAN